MKDLCDHVWYFLAHQGSKEAVAKLRGDLLKPLPGRDDVSESVVQAELAMFEKLRPKRVPEPGQARPNPQGV